MGGLRELGEGKGRKGECRKGEVGEERYEGEGRMEVGMRAKEGRGAEALLSGMREANVHKHLLGHLF